MIFVHLFILKLFAKLLLWGGNDTVFWDFQKFWLKTLKKETKLLTFPEKVRGMDKQIVKGVDKQFYTNIKILDYFT